MPEHDLSINAIRVLAIDTVQKANSGHPGLPMGAAAMAYTLWTRHLKHDPSDPAWPDRDRFVLSGGHGSALLYTLLHLAGYDLTIDDLKNFRQWESKTPGHPEHGCAPGVETTTGPLGQGFATAVGMAMAEAHLAARYNRPGHALVDHCTYVLASDGDMMEGVAAEAASLAGHLRLGKLICLYDANEISLAGATSLSFTEDVGHRFEAYGWQVLTVQDGNDVDAIDAALVAAQSDTGRPSLLVIKTIIGFGSPAKAGKSDVHGSPLGKEEVAATKQALGFSPDESFTVPAGALAPFREAAGRGAKAHCDWKAVRDGWAQAHPDLAAEWDAALSGAPPQGWDKDIPVFTEALATRASAGRVLSAIAPNYPALMGGSADLNPSTNTALKGLGDFQSDLQPAGAEGATGGAWSYAGRNVHFGVREHAMAAAANGMALHGGIRPYVATFFNFVDYLKPALRLSALMGQPVVYVFTHDSVALGEDGPTHQPIEQLAMLRATPSLTVLRPADANESAEAWKVAVEATDRPVALVLTRQKVPTFDRSAMGAAAGVRQGAYVLQDPEGGRPDVVLIGTGSEVSICVDAARELQASGVRARVVSMPSWDLFDAQAEEYRRSVLPPGVPRVAVEAGASLGWHKYVGEHGEVIAIDRFGASAPYEVIYEQLGLTPAAAAACALRLLGKA